MIGKWLSACDRFQQSRWFKIIASVIVVALAGVLFISYSVASSKARDQAMAPIREAQSDMRRQAEEIENAAKAEGKTVSSEELTRPLDSMDATARVVEGIVNTQHSVAGVGVGLAIATGIALVVIWLGLGITYLGLIALCSLLLGSVWGLEKLSAARRASHHHAAGGWRRRPHGEFHRPHAPRGLAAWCKQSRLQHRA